MPVLARIRARARRLMLVFVVFGLLTGGVMATQIAVSPPALAGTGGYPDAGATTIDASQYEWGYPCGSGCVTGWWAYVGSVKYGFLSPRGYAYRNCTDYVAWKLESEGVPASLAQGRGNGGQWDQNTTGVTIGSTPAVGDAAVIHHVYPGDPFGHVAYVEAVEEVNGSYQVKVSQYNWDQEGDYSFTGWEPASTYSDFVNFGITPTGGGSGSGGPVETYAQAATSVTYDGTLHVLYPATVDGNPDLRDAAYNGASWSFTDLDGDAGSLSGEQGAYYPVTGSVNAIVYDGTLQVFYTIGNGDLRNAWYDGTSWHFQNLDGDSGSIAGQAGDYAVSVGNSISSVVDSNDLLQLFYTGITTAGYGDLRHAWFNGSTWSFENLDGDPGSIAGQYATYATNAGNSVRAFMYGTTLDVVYQADVNGALDLRDAYATPTSGWSFVNIDGDSGSLAGSGHASNVGSYISAVVDGSSIQLFYTSNYGTGDLRHAYTNASGWNFENLDGDSGSLAGTYSTYATDPGNAVQAIMWGGTLEVFYQATVSGTLVLRHAWSGSSGWQFENFDGTSSTNAGSAGSYTTNPGGSFTDVVDGSGDLQMFYQGTASSGSVDLRHVWVTSSSPWYFENIDGDSNSIAGTLGVNATSLG